MRARLLRALADLADCTITVQLSTLNQWDELWLSWLVSMRGALR